MTISVGNKGVRMVLCVEREEADGEMHRMYDICVLYHVYIEMFTLTMVEIVAREAGMDAVGTNPCPWSQILHTRL